MSTEERDQRIQRRLARTYSELDESIADMAKAVRRVMKHRAKLSRLTAALAVPAEVRSQRARKALETRRARPAHRRAIKVREEE